MASEALKLDQGADGTRVLARRRAGVLLHPTSLPGQGPCGRLGEVARRWVDWLAEAGFSVWQTLPLAPPDPHGSPYSSASVFAADPRLLDGDSLRRDGLLSAEQAHGFNDSGLAVQQAMPALLHNLAGQPALAEKFDAFVEREASWLEDYALFRCLKRKDSRAWFDWPEAWRERHPDTLAALRAELVTGLQHERLMQFLLQHQWAELRRYARQRGVFLFGDLPFFVAHDSADVWAQPRLFQLDEHGHLAVDTGVPPDYFSEDGQLWHMPHYNWQAMADDEYAWWVARLRRQAELFDLVRIDHFRGLQAAWAVPAGASNARTGHWQPGPGEALLRRLSKEAELVAEDLGLITEDVIALLKNSGLPGMRVFQFGFDGHLDNPHLSENVPLRAVMYSGTHDNDTVLGWYRDLDVHTGSLVRAQVGVNEDATESGLLQAILQNVLATNASLAVLPMQDLLGLGSEARMNRPGQREGNWAWRMTGLPGADEAEQWRRALEAARRLT